MTNKIVLLFFLLNMSCLYSAMHYKKDYFIEIINSAPYLGCNNPNHLRVNLIPHASLNENTLLLKNLVNKEELKKLKKEMVKAQNLSRPLIWASHLTFSSISLYFRLKDSANNYLFDRVFCITYETKEIPRSISDFDSFICDIPIQEKPNTSISINNMIKPIEDIKEDKSNKIQFESKSNTFPPMFSVLMIMFFCGGLLVSVISKLNNQKVFVS